MSKPEKRETESFVFREAATTEELIALLRLKYSVYDDSRMGKFQVKSKNGLVIDCFDQYSRHFGLYPILDGVRIPIGYIRVTGDNEGPRSSIVHSVVEKLGIKSDTLQWSKEKPLPITTHSPYSKQVIDFYEDSKNKNEHLVEPGRLVLDPRYRSFRNAISLVESAIAVYFFSLRVDYAVIGCHASSAKFYSRYGFRPLPGTSVQHWDSVDLEGVTLIGSPDSVPVVHRERLAALAQQFEANKEIRFDRKKKVERCQSAAA